MLCLGFLMWCEYVSGVFVLRVRCYAESTTVSELWLRVSKRIGLKTYAEAYVLGVVCMWSVSYVCAFVSSVMSTSEGHSNSKATEERRAGILGPRTAGSPNSNILNSECESTQNTEKKTYTVQISIYAILKHHTTQRTPEKRDWTIGNNTRRELHNTRLANTHTTHRLVWADRCSRSEFLNHPQC